MATVTLKISLSKPRTFRPWPANQFALDRADKIGLNVSELLNEIVSKHLKRHIELKTSAMVRQSKLAPQFNKLSRQPRR